MDRAKKALALLQLLRLRRRLKKRRQQNPKRLWVHPILAAQKEEGEFQTLMPRLRLSADKFYKYMRMGPAEFDLLLTKISHRLERKSHRAISPEEQLTITLRFLATGTSYRALEFQFRRSHFTISMIVSRVCRAIWELRDEYLALPTNEEWLQIANGFSNRWNMPNCLGALDGKLVKLRKPAKSGTLYFDYKHNFSLNLLALCDDRYRLTFVDVGEFGHRGDANVFATSALKAKLESGELNIPEPALLPGMEEPSPLVNHFIVADAAFPLSCQLMKPFSGQQLSHEQRIYNYRLSRARRIIENVFGILCVKWRLLLKPIETSIENANWIVRAILVLHNFLIDESKGRYRPAKLADKETEEEHDAENGQWRAVLADAGQLQAVQAVPAHAVNWKKDAKEMRQFLVKYFNSDAGSVPWQEKMI